MPESLKKKGLNNLPSQALYCLLIALAFAPMLLGAIAAVYYILYPTGPVYYAEENIENMGFAIVLIAIIISAFWLALSQFFQLHWPILKFFIVSYIIVCSGAFVRLLLNYFF